MDVSKLKRDAKAIHSKLQRAGKSIKAKERVRIVVPSRFKDKQLVTIGNTVVVVGVYAILDDAGNYGVSLTNTKLIITPDVTNDIMIDDEAHLEFIFEPKSTIFPNVDAVRNINLPYLIFDEIISKGKTPWYLSYSDLTKLFDTAKAFAGVNLGSNHAIFEMLTAMRARQPDDKFKYLRHKLFTKKDFGQDYSIVPLASVQFGATNTSAKLIGARLDEGLASALVYPSEQTENIETILRT